MTHISDDEVRDLPLRDGRAELLEEIMATPVIDRADTPAPGPRRTPAVLAALVAAAAVIAAVVLPGYLLKNDDAGSLVGSGGDVCWTGNAPAAGDDCGTPTGQKGLVWAFPRLAGHLDQCDPIDASGYGFDDDLPMTFGTPNPGTGAAYRCTLADLGVSAADPGSPVLWVYAFGDDNGRDLRDYFGQEWYDPKPLTLDGEAAGQIITDEVGLVRPDEMFMAVYADFPFAVIGYANSHDEALDYLAALGMRAPSALTAPGQASPDLPDFPGAVLQGPAASPSAAADGSGTGNGTVEMLPSPTS